MHKQGSNKQRLIAESNKSMVTVILLCKEWSFALPHML